MELKNIIISLKNLIKIKWIMKILLIKYMDTL